MEYASYFHYTSGNGHKSEHGHKSGNGHKSDAYKLPAWAQGAVAAVVEAGLMEGKGNNIFDAIAGLTRAEA
ncbi:S-layer homology domain-containing protein [Cohnella sp. GCM10020058]|uniref:S-layer homology domain-containing protein n=1 Tax=Cohnella sp. GCM10020058 TaxID=3317330 RepID=UPI0036372F00